MYTNNNDITYLTILLDVLRIEKLFLLSLGVAFLVILSKSITTLSEIAYRKSNIRKNFILQIATVITFFLNISGGFYIFYAVLKPPQEFLIATLGSVMFASGLAIKDIVASVISGITIIIDPPFGTGDRILYKDIYGEVMHIGLRSVKIKNLDNQIITIPNQNFISDTVICANKGTINILVTTSFYFHLKSDLSKIKNILEQVVITSKYAYLAEPIITTLDYSWKADLMCYHLTLKAHTIDAKFEKEFQTDLIYRSSIIFKENGVMLANQ